jgi:hypothetical protein
MVSSKEKLLSGNDRVSDDLEATECAGIDLGWLGSSPL